MKNEEYLANLLEYKNIKYNNSNKGDFFVKNIRLFTNIFKHINQNKKQCDINLNFKINDIIFELKSDKKQSIIFQFDLLNVDYDILDRLFFSQITCSEFLLISSSIIDKQTSLEPFNILLEKSLHSWNRFKERIGYSNTRIYPSEDLERSKDAIKSDNIIWCYNKSCSGKTFLGINTLEILNDLKFVYNPSSNNICSLTFIELLLEYGTNISLLLDDLQCDIELAKLLLDYISNNKKSIIERNNHIFIVSWLSLAQSCDFKKYTAYITTIETNPNKLINFLKAKLDNVNLCKICDDNLALISAAVSLNKNDNKTADELENDLFEYFIKTSDVEQLKLIHILAVLGVYEFEIPMDYINRHGNLVLNNILTAKLIDNSIFFAHRTVSSFIAKFIEKKYKRFLLSRNKIITDYISIIDNKKKWKALLHLIGENKQTNIGKVSFIWNLMYEFQKNLREQTNIDPTWNNTPSSMYFVISTAEMLGVVDEYDNVVKALCSNFELINGSISIKYNALKTTDDFNNIKKRMITEDESVSFYNYEKGISLDNELIHKNWLFGLMIGLKEVLSTSGYSDLISKIEMELIDAQDEEGYWYPKRVPWVTARIIIGLSEAGYSIKDSFIKNGVDYLISLIDNNRWVSHTGGWNNEYETSSLCLEAIIKSGYSNIADNPNINKVINYLLDNKNIWMSEQFEIDGTTTACALLKINGPEKYLYSYIQKLTNRNIHNIIENKLDYNNMQSCKTTQIAYYVIELCWYILEQEMPDLLEDFINRSELGEIQEKGGVEMDKKQIFISYSDDSAYHVKKVKKIAEQLESQGYIVYFYENADLGTNNLEFMEKINDSDAILVIGTKKYKEKSLRLKVGGVWFETGILAQSYMNENYDKIIPIAFDEFEDSFASPFSLNKGIRVKRVDKFFLKSLTLKLDDKFRRS